MARFAYLYGDLESGGQVKVFLLFCCSFLSFHLMNYTFGSSSKLHSMYTLRQIFLYSKTATLNKNFRSRLLSPHRSQLELVPIRRSESNLGTKNFQSLFYLDLCSLVQLFLDIFSSSKAVLVAYLKASSTSNELCLSAISFARSGFGLPMKLIASIATWLKIFFLLAWFWYTSNLIYSPDTFISLPRGV